MAGQEVVHDRVIARKFELVDSEGNLRAFLITGSANSAILSLGDPRDGASLTIGVSDRAASIHGDFQADGNSTGRFDLLCTHGIARLNLEEQFGHTLVLEPARGK